MESMVTKGEPAESQRRVNGGSTETRGEETEPVQSQRGANGDRGEDPCFAESQRRGSGVDCARETVQTEIIAK